MSRSVRSSFRSIASLAALALAASSFLTAAKVRTADNLQPTFTYALAVNANCTLSLLTTGTVDFKPISGLGSRHAETAQNNPATTDCSANNAQLNFSDNALLNSTLYVLREPNAGRGIGFLICRRPDGAGKCYINSNNPELGLPIKNGRQVTNVWGSLPRQGSNPPGLYTDIITVTLTFI